MKSLIFILVLVNFTISYARYTRGNDKHEHLPKHRYHSVLKKSYNKIAHHRTKDVDSEPDPEGWLRNFRKAHGSRNHNSFGRGIFSELFKTSQNVLSSVYNLRPLQAVGHLVTGVVGAASEAVGHVGQLFGVAQKGVTGIVAKELNDLNTPESRDIRFLLFTQKNKEVPEIVAHDASEIEDTNFDKTKGLKILIHGFSPTGSPIFNLLGGTGNTTREELIAGVFSIKQSYLDKNSQDNIIIVDWTAITRTIFYPSAAAATRAVGIVVSKLLLSLHEHENIDPAKVHIIGFSLGAQASGTAGRLFHEEAGDKLGRITGLDPAGPGFDLMLSKATGNSTAPEDLRFMIDKGDAKFVDVIHSNAKLGGLGMVSNTGHANFFPNGGQNQPGCSRLPDDAIVGCSHSRSWRLYSESVGSKKYPACQCPNENEIGVEQCKCRSKNIIYMGDLCSIRARGIYYLDAQLEKVDDKQVMEDLEEEEEIIFEGIDNNNNESSNLV